MGLVDSSFTPSELILLRAEQFAPKSSSSEGHYLLCSDGVVNGPFLASMLMAVAILVNVKENALNIELRDQKRRIFSSKSSTSLCINPIGQPPAWSGYSLESAVLFTSGQLYAVNGDCSIRNVVHTILLENRKQPWTKIIEIVEWGLASSNWLMPVEGEAAAVFSTPFICPERVRELAFSTPIEEVRHLFTDCKNDTPQVWSKMLEEIKQGFEGRTI